MSWIPKHTVVVPIDFSEESYTALDVARDLTDGPANLHLIHVLPDLHPADPGVLWGAIDNNQRKKQVKDSLTKVAAERGLAGANVHAEIGDPGHEIVELAESLESDLIVITSRGRTGLKRFILGSVAERVSRHADIPVLVLPSR